MNRLLIRAAAARASEALARDAVIVAERAVVRFGELPGGDRLWAMLRRRREAFLQVADYTRRCERDAVAALMGERP